MRFYLVLGAPWRSGAGCGEAAWVESRADMGEQPRVKLSG